MSDPLATNHLKLPYLAAAQAQKHVTHNEALTLLDTAVQLAVLDSNLAAPPGSPTEGDRHIVAGSATGAWASHDGEIATWVGGAWAFATPEDGWLAFDVGGEQLLVHLSGAWTPTGGGVGALTELGVNATADTTNRLAVRSAAVLFSDVEAADGGSGDIRVIVNKETDADTATFLFQSGFSGRAEIGLAGDTDFVFKVSPDGTSWTDAIRIDKDTGLSTIPYDNGASGLSATTVQDAIDEVAAGGGGGGGTVVSVFGRTGAVTASTSDYDASQVDNDSGVSGSTVKDALNTLNSAVSGKQASDSDLTAIAGLTPTNDDIIQRKAGAWTNRTMAQLKSDLSLSKSDVGLGSVTNDPQLKAASNLSDVASASTARTNLGLGSAATLASSAVAQTANNLSDLGSASTARTNLGLGGAATLSVGTTTGTVAAGDDSRITGAAQKSSNLSDLANASTARTNLGLGSAATLASSAVAQTANNLSDLGSASTARTNLGLGGAATLSVGTTAGTVAAGDDSRITGAAQKSSNLSDLGSTSTARTNLGLGSAALLASSAVAQTANNLSDLGSAATAFGNIKQAATTSATGVVELATVAEAGAGTDTSRAVTAAGLFPAQADVASASTCNIGAAATSQVNITGTTTITAFDSVAAGIYRRGTFAGALTLTHNGTSLKLPGAANITTAASDRFGALSLGSGNWIVLWYQKADGTPIAGGGGGGGTAASQSDMESASSTSVYVSPGRQKNHPSHPKWWLFSVVSGGTPGNSASYGVSSLTDSGVGDLTVNFSTSFSASSSCTVAMPEASVGGTVTIFHGNPGSASSYEVKSAAVSGGAATDPYCWQLAGFGDQ